MPHNRVERQCVDLHIVSPPGYGALGVQNIEADSESVRSFYDDAVFWSTPLTRSQSAHVSTQLCNGQSCESAHSGALDDAYCLEESMDSLEPSHELHHEEVIRRYLMSSDGSESTRFNRSRETEGSGEPNWAFFSRRPNRECGSLPTTIYQGVQRPIEGRDCRQTALQPGDYRQADMEEPLHQVAISAVDAEPCFTLAPPDIIPTPASLSCGQVTLQCCSDSCCLSGVRRIPSAIADYDNQSNDVVRRGSTRREGGPIQRPEDNRISMSVPAIPIAYRGEFSATGRQSARRVSPDFGLTPRAAESSLQGTVTNRNVVAYRANP
eukprot:GHVS01083434.1.p2 GENE.GHVS01083434.1~~GHVS01083434.1.p2  ORF type:complete len:323 (-),score=4.50 GHVS01083434.1:306-1274(-)